MFKRRGASPTARFAAILALPSMLAVSSMSVAAERRIEDLLPADTVAFFHIRDVKVTAERFKKMPLYALCQEDAMKKFLEKPMARLHEKLKELEGKVGVNFKELAGFLSGQVVVALLRIPPPEEDKDIGLLLAADIGANGKLLEERIAEALEKVPAGTFEKLKEEAHGTSYTLLKFKEVKDGGKEGDEGKGEGGEEDDDDEEEGEEGPDLPPEIAYCVTGRLFIAALGQKTMADFLGNLRAAPAESLAASRSFREALERVGENHDLMAFANLKRFIEDIKEKAPPPEEDGPSADRIIKALGFDAIQWAAAGLAIEDQGVRTSCHLKAPGERRGLLKLLFPGGGDLRLPEDMPEAAGVVYAFRLRASDFLGELREMLAAMGPGKAAEMDFVIGMFQAEAKVDIKKDLFANAGDSHYIYYAYPKPYKAGSENPVFLIGLKDKEAFRTAVGKILDASGKEIWEEKEYLGHKYTTLKEGKEAEDAEGVLMPSPTFGVIGERFVMSFREEGMREYLRSIGKGRGKSLGSEPAVAEVLKAAPRNRVLLLYVDRKKVVESLIAYVRGENPFADMVAEKFGKYADMELLPDADVFKKYMGPIVAVFAATDDGYMLLEYDSNR
ncbi:MAG: hypothetical protein N3A38_03260 [Planctomycetota bacterium]|nr:hypothetical protein [Planctomycetota bacterium]